MKRARENVVVVVGLVAVALGLARHDWTLAYLLLSGILLGSMVSAARSRGDSSGISVAALAVAALPLIAGAILGWGQPLIGLPISLLLVYGIGLARGVTGPLLGLAGGLGRLRRGRHSTFATSSRSEDPLAVVQQRLVESRNGGGAYMGGWTGAGEPMQSNGRGSLGVIGGPGSGKSRAIIVPAVIAHPAPVVAVSTKPEVLQHSLRARSAQGRTVVFDPGGMGLAAQLGIPELRWSPVDDAGDYGRAMLTARQMVQTGKPGPEDHWMLRGRQLLAAMLHAAALAQLGMDEVLRWTLTGDLEAPADHLVPRSIPQAVMQGFIDTPEKERGSIVSTLSGVLDAYQMQGARRSALPPAPGDGAAIALDAAEFVRSRGDTIYIVAPATDQKILAPVIVGLLASIRAATYQLSAQIVRGGQGERRTPPVLFALDEAANIAPIPDLPALCSEAGGQGLQLLVVFQDLSQCRARWPVEGDGMLSLLSAIAILPGIRDPATLKTVSLLLGDYDRSVETRNNGKSQSVSQQGASTPSRSTGSSSGASWTTRREAIMEPSAIAQLPLGEALAIIGHRWEKMQLVWWDKDPVWRRIAEGHGQPFMAPARAPKATTPPEP